ncbi:hypothetical protein [Desertibacillus haloalkaliphilus]|uniref:hypothetical protein n=1 Tax=Desertibacillus haloalkaliphilus TaxID=1328930 RepID=UPI001C259940|nr:hypothetical protein [Desertibacillus haloalkaliphilus]MBU8908463.1 hypothetical protein [Desertibacillus haloalkaliphilus]
MGNLLTLTIILISILFILEIFNYLSKDIKYQTILDLKSQMFNTKFYRRFFGNKKVQVTVAYLRLYTVSFYKFILTNFFTSIIIFLCIYIIAFFILPNLGIDNISTIFFNRKYGFHELSDGLTSDLLMGFSGALTIILPASITLYLFIYRVQKTSFESLINDLTKNVYLIVFIYFNLLTIIYGYHLNYVITSQSEDLNASLVATNIEISRIDIWISLVIITLFLLMKSLKKLFRTINIRYILFDSILDLEKRFRTISYLSNEDANTFNRNLIENYYSNIEYTIESIYQMLKMAVDKNMYKIYDEQFHSFRTLIKDLMENSRDPNQEENSIMFYIISEDRDKYQELYSLVIKNYTSLVMFLINNHNLDFARTAIKHFNQLKPRNPLSEIVTVTDDKIKQTNDEYNEQVIGVGKDNVIGETNFDENTVKQLENKYKHLLQIYLKSLGELATSICNNQTDGVPFLIEFLETSVSELENQQSFDGEIITFEVKHIFLVYRTLILKVISKDDLNILTDASYSLTKGVTSAEQDLIRKQMKDINTSIRKLNSSKKIPRKAKEVLLSINEKRKEQLENKFKVLRERSKEHGLEQYENISMLILFQCLFKSIEISHHKSTGFLVKFLVTNFDNEKLVEYYHSFLSSTNPFESDVFSFEDNYTKGESSFNINKRTIKYCMKKMELLLLGQQIYIDESNLDFDFLPDGNYITPHWVKKEELNYLKNKIKSSKDLNMLWITDDKFLYSLERYFKNGFRVINNEKSGS